MTEVQKDCVDKRMYTVRISVCTPLGKIMGVDIELSALPSSDEDMCRYILLPALRTLRKNLT